MLLLRLGMLWEWSRKKKCKLNKKILNSGEEKGLNGDHTSSQSAHSIPERTNEHICALALLRHKVENFEGGRFGKKRGVKMEN